MRHYGPYRSLAKLNALLCAASLGVFLLTIFTSKNLINELQPLLVCGGASLLFYYVYKLLVSTSRVA